MARKREGINKTCSHCGKEFYIPRSWVLKRGKFHNRACYLKFLKKTFITMVLVLLCANSALAYTASYYTYQSCRREGTSGVWTASGEKFNEHDDTAAMWGVPFGTLVKVTNLANGKTVTVRINDRGPSKRLVKRGRIIDLSSGAFKKIASLKQGVINVELAYPAAAR